MPERTAEEAKAMLERAVAAVKEDKGKALDMFNEGESGTKVYGSSLLPILLELAPQAGQQVGSVPTPGLARLPDSTLESDHEGAGAELSCSSLRSSDKAASLRPLRKIALL
jgi:hypothetical protein